VQFYDLINGKRLRWPRPGARDAAALKADAAKQHAGGTFLTGSAADIERLSKKLRPPRLARIVRMQSGCRRSDVDHDIHEAMAYRDANR